MQRLNHSPLIPSLQKNYYRRGIIPHESTPEHSYLPLKQLLLDTEYRSTQGSHSKPSCSLKLYCFALHFVLSVFICAVNGKYFICILKYLINHTRYNLCSQKKYISHVLIWINCTFKERKLVF